MAIDVRPPDPPERAPGWMPGVAEQMRSKVHEQLFAQRTVFLDRVLDADTASLLAAQLMMLDAEGDGDRPVTVVVNSTGGPLMAVSALLDTIDVLGCPVDTVCLGEASGTAAVVVAAGTGRRRAGVSARFRLRLPEVGFTGDARRLEDAVAQHRRLHDAVVDRLVAVTGQERRLVERDVERARALDAEEARSYGLVDDVLRSRS